MSYKYNSYTEGGKDMTPEQMLAKLDRDAELSVISIDPLVQSYVWKSNRSVVPSDFVYFAFEGQPSQRKIVEQQEKGREIHMAQVIEMARSRVVTEEEKAEMRAAFGEGEVVVNVLTGERTQL